MYWSVRDCVKVWDQNISYEKNETGQMFTSSNGQNLINSDRTAFEKSGEQVLLLDTL